jgi:hypothetical protein
MSISTTGGGQRRRSTVSTGTTATAGKTPVASKSPAKTGRRPPRRPGTPVKVHTGRNRPRIALMGMVVAVAVGIIGYGGWAVYQDDRSWQDRASDIDGLVNYREKDPKALKYEKHTKGPLTYKMSPAVGGNHNNDWQNCMGDIYDAPIAQEHAVHSMEHGAVWITYRPGLPQAQIDTLAGKVRGREKMLMSPYEGLDAPISLQTWGYQLKVDNADDTRIDEFIKTLRVNSSMEGPNASCAQGITETGTTPYDLPPQQQ